MTEKTKKILVIAAGSALCLVLAVGIGLRFGGHVEVPSDTNHDTALNIKEPVIDITVPNKTTDPGKGAVNTGTGQTIQSDPVKPEEPDKPTAPGLTTLPDDHGAEDVPQEERNRKDPPSYEPEQTVVAPAPQPDMQGGYDQGGTYVPGFGYIESSGEGTAIQDGSIYESGNKVGNMD